MCWACIRVVLCLTPRAQVDMLFTFISLLIKDDEGQQTVVRQRLPLRFRDALTRAHLRRLTRRTLKRSRT